MGKGPIHGDAGAAPKDDGLYRGSQIYTAIDTVAEEVLDALAVN